jgi:taurine dioxygenase
MSSTQVSESRPAAPRAGKPVRGRRGSGITITPASPALGAVVSGIDLSRKQSPATIRRLRAALCEHSLLLFRDQHMTPEQQVAFSRRFGELEHHVLKDALMAGLPEIYILSTLRKNGKPVGRAGAGHYWHSDLSYMAKPSLGSLLYALEIPEVGGDTMFTNTAAAYDALSAPMRKFLGTLRAEHSFARIAARSARLGYARPINADDIARTPDVVHPVVRTHPETGRKALYVNPGFTTRIVNLSEEEGSAVLEFLYRHMTRPEFIYRHRWQQFDAVFWDNRSLNHYAVDDYDHQKARRHMYRTTLKGDTPF